MFDVPNSNRTFKFHDSANCARCLATTIFYQRLKAARLHPTRSTCEVTGLLTYLHRIFKDDTTSPKSTTAVPSTLKQRAPSYREKNKCYDDKNVIEPYKRASNQIVKEPYKRERDHIVIEPYKQTSATRFSKKHYAKAQKRLSADVTGSRKRTFCCKTETKENGDRKKNKCYDDENVIEPYKRESEQIVIEPCKRTSATRFSKKNAKAQKRLSADAAGSRKRTFCCTTEAKENGDIAKVHGNAEKRPPWKRKKNNILTDGGKKSALGTLARKREAIEKFHAGADHQDDLYEDGAFGRTHCRIIPLVDDKPVDYSDIGTPQILPLDLQLESSSTPISEDCYSREEYRILRRSAEDYQQRRSRRRKQKLKEEAGEIKESPDAALEISDPKKTLQLLEEVNKVLLKVKERQEQDEDSEEEKDYYFNDDSD